VILVGDRAQHIGPVGEPAHTAAQTVVVQGAGVGGAGPRSVLVPVDGARALEYAGLNRP
jgi:hypothetical protein